MTVPYYGQPMNQYGALAPGVSSSAYTPGQNLINQQLNPNNPQTNALQGQLGQQYGAIQQALQPGSATNPSTLATQEFQELSQPIEAQYQAAQRNAVDAGAGAGQLGSGQLTQQLTSDPFGASGLGIQETNALGNLAAQVSTQAGQQQFGNQLNALNAGQGLLGQYGSLGQQNFQDLAQQQGFQAGQSQNAFTNNLEQNQLLASLGSGSYAPDNGLGPTITGQENQVGAQNLANAGNTLGYLFQNARQTTPQTPPPYYGSGF